MELPTLNPNINRFMTPSTLRPPTAQQKESMAKDSIMLELLLIYTKIRIKDSLWQIEFPMNCVDAASPLMTSVADLPLNEFILFSQLIERFEKRLKDDEDFAEWLPAFHHAKEYLTPKIHGIDACFTPALEDSTIRVWRNVVESESTLPTSTILNLSAEDTMTHCLRNESHIGHLLTFLYLTDLFAILNNSKGPGYPIHRFFTHYPTRPFNMALITSYGLQIKMLRLLQLEGVDLDSVTRQSLRVFAQQYAESEMAKQGTK